MNIGMQNKKPFEIILYVGRVISLQSWVAKNHVTVKPCSISDYPSNFEGLLFSGMILTMRTKVGITQQNYNVMDQAHDNYS